jgi:hypothetical protein
MGEECAESVGILEAVVGEVGPDSHQLEPSEMGESKAPANVHVRGCAAACAVMSQAHKRRLPNVQGWKIW